MKHWVTYPLTSHLASPELLTGEALSQFARKAEHAGFSALAFTDHPAPSQRWMNAGGHDALDPFAALCFVAAVTERLALIPNIVVLPYRTPFIVAKAAATIDVLSAGRFVLSVAAGYLRSEYRAVGVDFDRRNELFDEALEVIRRVWDVEPVTYEGTSFNASEVSAYPKPGHIPIWIGGNSALARRRVARYGDGWNPFSAPARLARTTRTSVLETFDDLAPLIEHLRSCTEGEGRDPSALDIAFTTGCPGPAEPGFEAAQHLDALDRMSSLGVTWNSVPIACSCLDEALEALERYGHEVIDQFDR